MNLIEFAFRKQRRDRLVKKGQETEWKILRKSRENLWIVELENECKWHESYFKCIFNKFIASSHRAHAHLFTFSREALLVCSRETNFLLGTLMFLNFPLLVFTTVLLLMDCNKIQVKCGKLFHSRNKLYKHTFCSLRSLESKIYLFHFISFYWMIYRRVSFRRFLRNSIHSCLWLYAQFNLIRIMSLLTILIAHFYVPEFSIQREDLLY